MNVFAIPLLIFFALFLLIGNVWYASRIKDPKKKKIYIVIRVICYSSLIIALFLFGPLFVYSPIKIGYLTKIDNGNKYIYPTNFKVNNKYSANNIDKVINDINYINTNSSFFGKTYPAQFLFVNSRIDMIRLGGNFVGGAGATGIGGTIVLFFDEYISPYIEFQHELTHYYLYKDTQKSASFFPRWFDEGLAMYLSTGGEKGSSESTQYNNIQKWREYGTYESDLSHWDGLLGYLRWQFYDTRKRPYESYFQSDYLISYLIREKGGMDKMKLLIGECQKNQSFEDVFTKTYGENIAAFHQEFLKDVEETT